MIERTVLILSMVMVLILAVRLLRRTRGVSLLAWHVLFLALALEPGALFVTAINNGSVLSSAPSDEAVALRMIFSLILVNLVAIACLGFLFGSNLPQLRFIKQKADRSAEAPHVFWLGIAIVTVGVISFLFSPRAQLVFQHGLEGIGDYEAYYRLRYELSQIASPVLNQYLEAIGLVTILPLLTLYSLYRFLKVRRRRWLVRWCCLVSIWSVVALLSYAKWPILSLILSNVALLVLSGTIRRGKRQRRQRRKWVTVLAGTLGILLAVYAVYGLLGATDDPATSVALLWQREVVVPVLTTYNHFFVFPDLHSHTYYQTSRTLNLLLAGGMTSGDAVLPAYYIASEILTRVAFNMNTSFVGSGWAEMGYTGVVQCAFLIFGVFTLWDLLLLKKKVYGSLTVLAAFFVGRGDHITNVDLYGMLLTGGAIFAPLFMLLLSLTAKRKKKPGETQPAPLLLENAAANHARVALSGEQGVLQ